jgi:hypothetical protein
MSSLYRGLALSCIDWTRHPTGQTPPARRAMGCLSVLQTTPLRYTSCHFALEASQPWA